MQPGGLGRGPGRSGSEVKLKPWAQRKHKMLGQAVNGRPAPLIDQVHALMHLWKAGDVQRVDEYISGAACARTPSSRPSCRR